MHTVQEYFISLILSYKIRIKTALICCTANQVGTGHKLHLQRKKSSLDQIGSNQQHNRLWQGWGVMQKVQKYFISFIFTNKIRKKTDLLNCTSDQVGTCQKLHFQTKNPTRAKLAVVNNKNWLWHGWGMMQTAQNCFISLILSYKSMKKSYLLRCITNQVGTCHKHPFQPKKTARTKLSAISNKHGCGTAEVWFRQLWGVSYHCN